MLANMKSCHTRMPSSSHRSWKASALVDHRAADAHHVHARHASAVRERCGNRRHRPSRLARSSGVQHTPRQKTSTPLIVRPNPSPSVPRSTSSVRNPTRPRSYVDRFATRFDGYPNRIQRRLPVGVRPPALDIGDSDMSLQHRLPGWQTLQSELAAASVHVHRHLAHQIGCG